MGVGKKIREIRKRLGLGQGELARLAGVKQSTLSDLEKGRSAAPRGDTLVKIAAAMEVDQDSLMSREGTPMQRIQPDADESALVRLYRDLSSANRAALVAAARAMRESQPDKQPPGPEQPAKGPPVRRH